MKTLKELRENRKKGISSVVKKKGSKYQAIIDGDVLDTYDSEKEAKTGIQQFLKHYKG